MNIFEYISKALKEELNAILEEIPELILDLTQEEWDEYIKGDMS